MATGRRAVRNTGRGIAGHMVDLRFLPDPAAVVKFGIDSPMAGERKARFRSDDSLSLTAVLDFCLRSWALLRTLAQPATGATHSSKSDPHPRGPSAVRDTRVVSQQDRRSLGRLLDAMDDHFDRRISDQEFLRLAASTRDSLNPPAGHEPGMAAAVRALENLLRTASGDPLPAELYGNLRLALAELEEPLEDSQPNPAAE